MREANGKTKRYREQQSSRPASREAAKTAG